MVKCWNQKCLILLAVTFSFLFVRVYADPKADQENYKKYMEALLENIKKNEHWITLEDTNKAEVIKKVFFQDNRIKLSPEILRDQYNKLDNPEQFANELLDPNSHNTLVKLAPNVLLDQYNKLDKPEEFLNALLTENSTHNVKVKLDPQVLKEQYNKLDKPDEFLSRLLIVSDDIQTTIKNFDPTFFFPKLFSRYLALTAAHSGILSDALNYKTSLKWEALNRLYQTDIEGFIQW